jgi:hypothetical protein
MSTIRGSVLAVWAIVIVLWLPAAIAADSTAIAPGNTSGAMPGDDSLTCEQIYAQGSAETQRGQQERARRNEERRMQLNATAALVTGTMATGGLLGTGPAAQMAAEAQADQAVAELGRPQSNPRMDHLKQLWAQKHCVRN